MLAGTTGFILVFLTMFNGLQGLPTTPGRRLEETAGATEGDMFFAPTSSRGVAIRRSGARWTNGIVPYEILPGFRVGSETIIVNAMRRLERAVAVNNASCIQFRPKISSDTYSIKIQNGDGCSSYVGQPSTPSFNHLVNLQDPGCIDDGRIMHELLHTLGFLHEQSRPDRDSYVRVNTQNIVSGLEHNFLKYDNGTVDTQSTPYDYGSVMHYERDAFSSNGFPTIEPVQANVTIGQRITISPIDALEVQLFYGCRTTATSSSTTATTTTPTVTSTYAISLTNRSAIYTRYGHSAPGFYLQALQIYVLTAGRYSFISNSTFDTYGYLYNNSFNPSNTSSNLLTSDDDSAGNLQFSITMYLDAGRAYVLVATTYAPGTTGPISITASGPNRVYIISITPVTSTMSATTTSTTTTTTARCATAPNRSICPERGWTSGRVVSIAPAGRTLTSLSFSSGGIFFNLEDPVSISGYVRTITVQYHPRKMPTNAARIRIYGIVPVSGGYVLCSQYLIPTVQITSQVTQTYTLPDYSINVFNTTYIGIGIQDTSASIATTYGGLALWAEDADQINGAGPMSTVYFKPHVWRFGAKITSTITT